MDHKTKFAAEKLLELQESLDQVPPYEPKEVSKQQTIRILSPKIAALRAKGYGWAAIAAMLTERGVPVSAAALRTYLRRVAGVAEQRKRRTSEGRTRAVRDRVHPTEPPPAAGDITVRGAAPSTAATSSRTGAASTSDAAAPTPADQPTGREPTSRRSEFRVRPDSDEI